MQGLPKAKRNEKEKMNMKKLLSLTMAAAMAVSLAACGGSASTAAPS